MLLGDAAASPGTMLEITVATYIVIGTLLFLRARPARVPAKSLSIILMPETIDVTELCKYGEWRELVQTLTTADEMAATGAISAAEHKATWQHAYYRLGAVAHL